MSETEDLTMLDPDHQMKLLYPHRPWESEPDHAEWTDPSTGYKCRIQRNTKLGFLCGYVGVNRFHPAHGMHYGDMNTAIGSDVHGGLTYSKKDGELWWFGFDCGHADDFAPKMAKKVLKVMSREKKLFRYESRQTYRTWEYVETEIMALVRLLSKANVTWAER
jgi:hypothetical protein